jgi:flagellar motor switch/type III secretory pathway protein FliN
LSIRGYPWGSLDRLPRAVARGARAARRQLAAFVELDSVGRALAELVGAEIELVARPSRRAPERERFAETTLDFGGTTVGIGVSPDLATALLSRVLARSITLEREDTKLDPALLGALGALAVEVARRAAREPVSLSRRSLPETLVSIDVTVRVDGKPHAAYVLVNDSVLPGSETEPTLDELGNVEVALPLVIAVSLATPSELDALRPGAAWLPGAGALANARGVGRGVLAAPNGEAGAPVDLTADGRIVLREGCLAIAPDEPITGQGTMAQANGDDTLTEAVLEAPVVVRVELGAVSMPASDWAKLRPGDVIETGQRVAEPVVLRIAGHAVARGELVDVDGELGVRIRELVKDRR